MPKPTFKDFMAVARKHDHIPRKPIEDDKEEPKRRSVSEKREAILTWRRMFIIGILFVATVLVLIRLSARFGTVTVTVIPVSEGITMNDVYTATLSGSKTTEPEDSLIYKVMRTEISETASLSAASVEKVEVKASGEIVVYNNYSESSVRLISGTRFETADGKIFKINKAITVPGRKTVQGKVQPGSLTVTVYASEAGESYNIGPSDYTLPGLKGGPRYNAIYAKGKGNMTGGYIGEQKIVPASEISAAKKKLEETIGGKIAEKIKSVLPPGYMVIGDASFVTYTDNSAEMGKIAATSDKVNLIVTGKIVAAIADGGDIAAFFAKEKIPGLENYKVHSPDLGDLFIKTIGKNGIELDTDKVFSFRVEGDAKMVWDLDTDSFKRELVGLSKDSYQEIFKKYPMIEKADAVFSPSWSSVFPSDSEKITVNISEN